MHHRLYSVPYCSAPGVKMCNVDSDPIIVLRQDSIVANPKQFQPSTHSSGNLNILYNYQEVPLQHNLVSEISFWLIIHHGNLFPQDFIDFSCIQNTIYWVINFVSKFNAQNRPGTFTMKPDIDIQLSVKLHVVLEATILVPLLFRWHAPLRFSVSWSPGRHWKWRIR